MTLTSCGGGRSSTAQAADDPTTMPSPSPTATTAPAQPSSSSTSETLQTVGPPVSVTFSLAGAGKQARTPEVAGYKAFMVALTTSSLTYTVNADLKAATTPDYVRELSRGISGNQAAGRNVRSKPVGRLVGVKGGKGSAVVTTCLWGPSVAFYDNRTGKPAEKLQKWFEVRVDMSKASGRWVVAAMTPTGRSCAGGAA